MSGFLAGGRGEDDPSDDVDGFDAVTRGNRLAERGMRGEEE
jgi:homoserine dehydrogenase